MIQFLLTQIGKLKKAVSTLNSKTNRMFSYLDEIMVPNDGTFSFSMVDNSRLAIVTANFGDGRQTLHIIGSRNNNELAIQPIVQSNYLTITNDGYTVTGTCEYSARVIIYRT